MLWLCMLTVLAENKNNKVITMLQYVSKKIVDAFELGEVEAHSDSSSCILYPKNKGQAEPVVIGSEYFTRHKELIESRNAMLVINQSGEKSIVDKTSFLNEFKFKARSSSSQADRQEELDSIARGLDAERVSVERIDELVDSLDIYAHVIPGTTTTIATAIDRNGFTIVTTESGCVSPENFCSEKGIKIAKNKALQLARSELWKLEGYALKQRLVDRAMSEPTTDQ